MERDGESQATMGDLILEKRCGRQASNVRGRGSQSYTYLVSTNHSTRCWVEGARRLSVQAYPATRRQVLGSSEGQEEGWPYASLTEACAILPMTQVSRPPNHHCSRRSRPRSRPELVVQVHDESESAA